MLLLGLQAQKKISRAFKNQARAFPSADSIYWRVKIRPGPLSPKLGLFHLYVGGGGTLVTWKLNLEMIRFKMKFWFQTFLTSSQKNLLSVEIRDWKFNHGNFFSYHFEKLVPWKNGNDWQQHLKTNSKYWVLKDSVSGMNGNELSFYLGVQKLMPYFFTVTFKLDIFYQFMSVRIFLAPQC